ncbi:hypothetical protein ABZ341_17060 [Streptomyces sp. NPDC006173]|uniref:hypothetical protein n=1 Tax=Streptomyces sp. NPDC006173 TaxID=3155349 RepID=UPI0033DFE939
MSAINWGDAPTWLGAVFAAAAAAAAVWTLKSQRDQIGEQRVFIAEQSATLALERAALVNAAADRRRAQAEEIVWERHGWALVLTNHSRGPIADVRLQHPSGVLDTGSVEHTAASTNGIMLHPVAEPYPVLGSSQQLGCTRPERSPDPVIAMFTDDSGVRWRLDEHGKLDEIPSTP